MNFQSLQDSGGGKCNWILLSNYFLSTCTVTEVAPFFFLPRVRTYVLHMWEMIWKVRGGCWVKKKNTFLREFFFFLEMGKKRVCMRVYTYISCNHMVGFIATAYWIFMSFSTTFPCKQKYINTNIIFYLSLISSFIHLLVKAFIFVALKKLAFLM